MKLQIRQGCFETNSSSTHSLVIYENSDWERFKNGEMAIKYGAYYPELVEVADENKDQIFDKNSSGKAWDYSYLTYEVWSKIWNYCDEGWETIEKDVADKHVVSYFQQEC